MVSLQGGADEAGRGCVVGPLVVAGVSATRSGIRELKELGVRDSKTLSPRRREALYPEILKVCSRVHWAHIEPAEIDAVVRTGKKFRKLNYLEALYFAKVIDQLDA
ncbi:MAG: ribonuclease HII, partial [Nitrososphaerales archaeon]